MAHECMREQKVKEEFTIVCADIGKNIFD